MTTLNQIRSHSPCQEGWTKLLKHLGKTQGDDEPLSLLTILESNGLNDAIWCLRTEPTPERIQRFALAIVRRVEHLNPEAEACNDVTERYLSGQATKAELVAARAAAANEAADAAADAADAADASAYTANEAASAAANTAAYAAAGTAASAAACAAANTVDATYAAACYAATCAANTADDAAARATYAAERKAQGQIFKEIFA
jgi:hypothetical protein